MAAENSSRNVTEMPLTPELVSGRPSLSHLMLIGGSPLIMEQSALAREPSSMKRGKANGSITGGPAKREREGRVRSARDV